MRRLLLAVLLIPLLAVAARAVGADDEDGAAPPEPVGVWRADLERSEEPRTTPRQVVLRIRQGKDGRLTATIDGLSGSQRNLKVENLILIEDVLSFQVPQVDGRFAGNFYGDSLRGNWSQGEGSRPLIFYRD